MTSRIDMKLFALGAAVLFSVTIVTAGFVGVQPRPKHSRHTFGDAQALRHATVERKIAPLEFEEAPSIVPIVDTSEIIPSADLIRQPNGFSHASIEFRIAPRVLQAILQI
jgi:hypothetical protein